MAKVATIILPELTTTEFFDDYFQIVKQISKGSLVGDLFVVCENSGARSHHMALVVPWHISKMIKAGQYDDSGESAGDRWRRELYVL